MKKFFSTADVHSRDSFDYWHEVRCKKIIEHDCIPESREGFRGELEGGAVGDISLVSFENSSAMYCRATRRHVGHSTPMSFWSFDKEPEPRFLNKPAVRCCWKRAISH